MKKFSFFLILYLSIGACFAADMSYESADTASLVASQPARAARIKSMFDTVKNYVNAVSGAWVSTDRIVDDAITGVKINASALGDGLAKDGSANATVDLATLAGLEISSAKLKAKVDDSSIEIDGSGQLSVKASGISSTELASDSVTADEIASGAVTENALGSDSVTASKIKDAEVNSAEIASGAVNNDEIGSEAVTYDKIKSLIGGTLGTTADTDYGDVIKYRIVSGKATAYGEPYDFSAHNFGANYHHFYIPTALYLTTSGSGDLRTVNFSLQLNGIGSMWGQSSVGNIGGELGVLIIGIKKQ